MMGEEAKKDASMNAFLLQTDLTEMEGKKKEVLARIGEAVYEANQGGTVFGVLRTVRGSCAA